MSQGEKERMRRPQARSVLRGTSEQHISSPRRLAIRVSGSPEINCFCLVTLRTSNNQVVVGDADAETTFVMEIYQLLNSQAKEGRNEKIKMDRLA